METILGPWMYDGQTTNKREVTMSDTDARQAAIRGLIGKAKSNRGEQTDDGKARANAVAVLAGKRIPDKQMRPEVRDLLNESRS